MTKIEVYKAVLAHDKGRFTLKIVSLSGREGAICQIMAAEGCPRSAIKSISKTKWRRNRIKGAQ
jgi:hypothetical protein